MTMKKPYLYDVLELNEEGVNYNVWLLDEVEINMDMCGERLTIYTSQYQCLLEVQGCSS